METTKLTSSVITYTTTKQCGYIPITKHLDDYIVPQKMCYVGGKIKMPPTDSSSSKSKSPTHFDFLNCDDSPGGTCIGRWYGDVPWS